MLRGRDPDYAKGGTDKVTALSREAAPSGDPLPVSTFVDQASHCSEPGCEENPVERCNYVDSHGTPCRTQWCAEHSAVIGGLRNCRRHAGTIAALGSKANNPRALPDVGNRGASLVRWVYRDLDAGLNALLESQCRANEHLLRDTEVAVGRSEDGGRRWEMSWKLASPEGIRVRISLMVEEADDSVVLVRLGDEVVASGTPPWIEARRNGHQLSDDEDREQRRAFYAFLENYLKDAVRSVR
jgi:hypothetical protein